jgi:eukaryotic-like serine/threonine-protein kinase
MRASPHEWKQAFELADEAFELTADARERWLGALAPEHAHLVPLLREMFANRTQVETDKFLHTLPQFTILPELLAHGANAGPAVSASSLEADVLVGPYRLIRELGAGGMGTVWLAERADGTMKRAVALKLPYAGPFQRQIAERFARERDILAALVHKNIARLYDAGATEQGQPYLAMEYFEGVPINQYCDDHQLSIPARLQLFRQVLSAVQYAHANLVLHRDLKPSNVLVNKDGTVGLLDFGIAKVMTGAETHATEITEMGGAALTPDYASPEQINGAALSTASDVYSLGVILFELLAGARPYRLKRGTRGELEEAITSAEATRPSRAAGETTHPRTGTSRAAELRQTTPEKLSRALAGDLDTIVLKALKKKPGDRYATVAALDDDLGRYLRGDVVLARPDSALYRLQKFAQKNKFAVASVAAVMLALAAGLSVALWQANKAKHEAERSDQRANFWADLFADVAPRNHTQPMPSVRELLARGETLLPNNLPAKPDLQATLYADLARTWRTIGSYQKAIPFYEKGLEKTEEMHGATSQEARDYRISLQRHYAWGMHYQRFFAFEPKVRDLCAEASDFRNERCVRLANARAYLYINAGHLLTGERQIAADLANLRGGDALAQSMAVTLEGLNGKSLIVRGDVLRGRPAALRTVKAARQPPMAQCYQCLYQTAQMMMASGNLAAAKPYVAEFLQRHDSGVGGHAYVANELLRTAANFYAQFGDYERGVALYMRAIDASLQNYGPDNADLAHGHRELGLAHLRAGKLDDARRSLTEAARIHVAIDPRPNHWASQIRIALAGIDALQGNTPNAIEVLRAEKLRAETDQDDANLALSLYWLARAEADDARAVTLAGETLDVLRRGGRGRTALAMDANLLIVERAESRELRKRHAVRAMEVVSYMFGRAHGYTIDLGQRLQSRGLRDGASSALPSDAAVDKQIDAVDAELAAYAASVLSALRTAKP